MTANLTTETFVERGSYITSPATVSIAAVALALFLWRFLASNLDPREPPEVVSKVPFIGHLLGMLKYQIYYLERVNQKFQWPIYTLRVFSSRIYVICSAELVHNAFRIPKTLVFEPFIIESCRRMFNVTEESMKVIKALPEVEDGESYMSGVHQVMYQAMVPGQSLLEMNSRVLANIALSLDQIGVDELPHGLYRWMRDALTIASADALYGPKNPIAEDKNLINSLWEFQTDCTWLMLEVFPSIIARKAYYGRANINAAFRKYYAAGQEKNASGLVTERAKVARKYGISEQDIADFEVSMLFASTTNTIPGSFWFLSYILSSPTLLAEVRTEVAEIVTRKMVDGIDTVSMDITGFQKKCPLLCSTWQETLRLVNSSSSVRMVAKDTIFADKYLLKAGSVVQMPAGITHNSTEIWGDDAATFNPRRFIRPEGKQDAAARERRKLQTQGYFPFGGGKHLCPGRHFAFTEIVGFVATLAYGFEFSMADGSGAVVMPGMEEQKLGTGVRKPASDVNVLIKRRPEFDGVKWTYFVGGEVDFKTLSSGEHEE